MNVLKFISETEYNRTYGGYGVVFGGRDAVGDTFTKDTFFGSPQGQGVYIDHTMDTMIAKDGQTHVIRGIDDAVGKVVFVTADEFGLYMELQVEKANQYADIVAAMIATEKAGLSTGTASHLRKPKEIGIIKQWPIIDTSITLAPMEPRTIGVERLKFLASRDNTLKAFIPEVVKETTTDSVTGNEATADNTKERIMNNDELQALIQSAVDNTLATLNDQKEAQAEQDEVKQLRQRVAEMEAATAKAATPDNDSNVATKAVAVAQYGNLWKYDNIDEGDLSMMIGILDEAGRSGRSRRGASENARKALAIRVAESKEPAFVASHMAMKAVGMPFKANELNQSTLSGYGDEWVGVTYSSQLWDSIRFDTPILGNVPTIEVPQGSESITIPLSGAAPTFYKVAQASAQAANPGAITRTVTTSKLATANTSLTVGKLGASTYFTGELEEDSLIPWIPELRSRIQLEGAEVLESMVIDGDTATGATTNINDIGGTPAGTEYWLNVNGFRKLALVTNTANSRDGGALTVEDYLETVKLMGLAGKNALNKDRVAFILDAWTHWKTLELDEVKTRDVFIAPTVENGMLTNIWGYRVYASGNMHRSNQDSTYGLKANSAGKVDLDTASNNTTGSILAVRWDQWRLGWKRRITFETVRVPSADATEIVALLRVGLVYRDTEASAISYNLTL